MAQVLRRNGEDVRLLAMFNGPSPSWIKQWGSFGNQPSHREQRVESQEVGPALSGGAKALRVLFDAERRRRWRRHLVWRARKLALQRIERRWAELRVRRGRPVPERLREEYFLRLHAVAEHWYQPKIYDGEILMFSGAGLYDDLELGWTGLAEAGIRTHPTPGEHIDNRSMMREPNVRPVAEILLRYLDELQPLSASPSQEVLNSSNV
jgi:thioesterase domain-containing protein